MLYFIGQDVTVTSTVTDGTGAPTDPDSITCTVTAPDGTVSTPTVTPAGTGISEATVPSVSQVGDYAVLWQTVVAGQHGVDVDGFSVRATTPAPAFANPADVAARWRPLTAAELTTAEALCEDASALIRARFPGIDASIASGAVPAGNVLMVCANMVKRALIAPADGVSQQSETAGPFSHSQSYANPMRNVFLTAADETLILGYQPSAVSAQFSNTTCRVENSGPAYVYGWF